VAIWADDVRCPVDDALTGAAHVLAHKLRQAGAAVSMDARPDIDLDVNRKVYWQLTAANRAFGFGTDDGRVNLLQYRQAQESREKIRRAWNRFFAEYDILIAPSHSTLAFLKDHSPADNRRTMTIMRHGKEETVPYYSALWWAMLTNVGLLPSTTFPCGKFTCATIPIEYC
jgi:amidase